MSSDWKSMLKEAKELFDNELITEDEYNQMRKEALELRKSNSSPPVNKEPNILGGSSGTIINSPQSNPLGGGNPLDGHGTIVGNIHS